MIQCLRNGNRKRRLYITAFLMLFFFLSYLTPNSAQADEHEYKIEAVFLYNFLSYITWPGYHAPEDMKQATICITSEDPIHPYLEYIQHKRAQERHLDIRQMDSAASMAGCQIFFVRDIKDEDIAKLSTLAMQSNILLVSTKPGFIDKGGMISLLPEGDRIAINIDNSQLSQAGFRVSSRLLDLANEVK